MFGLDFRELIVLGIVAVMLFGRRLPEVARSLGKSYHQFKKGLNEIKREMDEVVYTTRTEVRTATSNLLTYDEDAIPGTTIPPFQPMGKNTDSDSNAAEDPQTTTLADGTPMDSNAGHASTNHHSQSTTETHAIVESKGD